MSEPLTKLLNSRLPQTQCRKCGFPTCLEYAHAVANNTANTNLCSPGGKITNQVLQQIKATHTNLETLENSQKSQYKSAQITESQCIGCTLCIRACPFDAIVGTKKSMHTVLTDDCTGCELCIPACPVDCIAIKNLADLKQEGNFHADKVLRKSYYELSEKNSQLYEITKARRDLIKTRKEKERNTDEKPSMSQFITARDVSVRDSMIRKALQIAEDRIKQRKPKVQQSS